MNSLTSIKDCPPPVWRYITKELAQQLWSTDDENRPIRKIVVNEYRRLMDCGLWRLSPYGIVIGPDGRASDGNHRLHALAQSRLEGFWFLVYDWNVSAADLRVDLHARRSVSDFINSMSKRDLEPLSLIASQCGIGGGRLRDPAEMLPVVEVFGHHSAALTSACAAKHRGVASASVRAMFCLAMHERPSACDYLCDLYRSLVLGDQGMPQSMYSLYKQLVAVKMEPQEIMRKTLYAITHTNHVRAIAGIDMVEILHRLRSAIGHVRK